MTACARERRAFLKAMVVGVGGVPLLASLDSWAAFAASAPDAR
jgi:hypothetical protein